MESINKDEILKSSKWIRFIFMVLYAFALNFALTICIGLAFVQFLFVLFTDKRSENVSKIAVGFRNYMVQILDYLNYQTGDKPFPFSDFPKSNEEEK